MQWSFRANHTFVLGCIVAKRELPDENPALSSSQSVRINLNRSYVCLVDLGGAHCVCLCDSLQAVHTVRSLIRVTRQQVRGSLPERCGLSLHTKSHLLINTNSCLLLLAPFIFPPVLPSPSAHHLYLILLSVRPSPWPRKVAMETEADLTQGYGMNYTASEAVCNCAEFFSFLKVFLASLWTWTVSHECDGCMLLGVFFVQPCVHVCRWSFVIWAWRHVLFWALHQQHVELLLWTCVTPFDNGYWIFFEVCSDY